MDNNDPELEALEKRFDDLPDEVAGALVSEETASILDALSEAHKLDPQKKDLVLKTVGDVLLGFIPLHSFKNKLEISLALPQPQVQGLAEAIAKDIFGPIRDEILSLSTPATPQRQMNAENVYVREDTMSSVHVPNAAVNPVSLSEQIAQFQARKKAREEEERMRLQKNTPGIYTAPPTNLPMETSPATPSKSPQPTAPADPYREPLQ